MNIKKIITVVLLVIVVITSLFTLTGCGANENINNKSNNTSSEVFCGKTSEEWKKIVEEYYSINNLDNSYETIECYYNDKGEFVATVSTKYEVSAEYVFDEETGYAKDIFTQDIIDFKNNKVIERASKTTIDFQENYVLGVGYVSDRSLNKFINSNFHDETFYNSLDIYDYRDNNKNEGYGNRFVIIPKSNAVKISLYTCKLGDDGRLKKDEVLIESTDKSFIIYDDYVETMPKLILGYSYEGIRAEFPLIFDGVSGELLIEDNKVLNISMY